MIIAPSASRIMLLGESRVISPVEVPIVTAASPVEISSAAELLLEAATAAVTKAVVATLVVLLPDD